MIPQTEIQQARRLLRTGIALIAVITFLGTGLLIHYGSKSREDFWATVQTIEAKPSLEIRP